MRILLQILLPHYDKPKEESHSNEKSHIFSKKSEKRAKKSKDPQKNSQKFKESLKNLKAS